jgi:MFS transporter, putative metabolite transport protein
MKSIQEYIDERPVWPDGTQISGAPMTNMQWLIWSLAAAGKFFEGYVVFMTGVALPLISREFEIGSAQNGLIGVQPTHRYVRYTDRYSAPLLLCSA